MSCFDLEDNSNHGVVLNNLVEIVSELQDQKQRRENPERYAIESGFNELIKQFKSASRRENGPGPMKATD